VKRFKTRVNSPGIHAIWEKGKAELPYQTRKQACAPAGMVKERQTKKQRSMKHQRVAASLKRVQQISV